MGSIVLYIMEWAFALIVLLTIYKAVFSGTTFYRFNRFYLLGATLLSALLPLVHFTIPEKAPVVSGMAIESMDFAQELTGTFVLIDEPQETMADNIQPDRQSSLWAVVLVCMYSAYVIMLLTGWTRSVIRARKFLRGKNRRRISRTVWLVTHDEDFGPFSWMNYIVISDTESGFARRASLRHEYSHVRLLHSVDLVFLLACTILNPVCWLVLQEIKIVHEYEADNEVINRYGIRNSDYQKLLIMRTVGAEAYALASSFNLNIKKRIIMMNKNKTRKSRLIWLLLLIPMLGMTSVLFARTEKAVNLDDKLRFTQSDVEMPYRLPEPAEASLAITKPQYIRVVEDDEVISDEDRKPDEMIIRQRNVMTIQINKNNDIYVNNGLIKRVITIDELKDLAKQFIKNPDNDSRLPIIEDYDIEGYGTVKTTVKHIFSLQYDRSSSAGVWSDVRYELYKAYNELRDEVCVSKFGKVYDQCSDSEQQFARAMYAMKISEALPKSYDGEGNLIIKEVKSAAGNYVIKDEKVNKDLRIRVINNPPVRLYVSTVIFDNENGQDQFKSETDPIQISLENLDDYIDQAISDGMKIRKVRLAIHPDVPMGAISDLKETLRNRMLLSIVQESYNKPAGVEVTQYNVKAGDIIKGMVIDQENGTPIVMANVTEIDAAGHIRSHSITDNEGRFSFRLVDPSDHLLVSYSEYLTVEQPIAPDQVVILGKPSVPYYELLLEVTTDEMNARVTSNRRFENGGKETISTNPVKLNKIESLGEYIDKAETNGKHITSAALSINPDVQNGLLTDIKTLLRQKRILSIHYVGIKATDK